MKVAYIYILLKNSSVGVVRKVLDQEVALRKLNNDDFEIIVLSTEKESSDKNLRFVKYGLSSFPMCTNFMYIFAKYYLINKSIKISSYDKVIIRYVGADLSGVFFMKKHRNVIFEVHAIEADEFKSKIQYTNSLIKKLIRSFRLVQELTFRRAIFKRAYGFITMSDEIVRGLNKIVKGKINAKTIANGIDTSRIKKTGFSTFDGNHLKVVFIGSRPDSWHGIDRLVKSVNSFLSQFPEKKIELHFIGGISINDIDVDISEIKDSIIFHDLKYGNELDDIMEKMHIAVGPLALYRKKLNDVSALKTCEYTARGIPFFQAFNDPNLFSVDSNFKFYKIFPNNDSIIDFSEIYEFMETIQKRKIEILNYMENYTKKHLDWTVKLNLYIDFASKASAKLLFLLIYVAELMRL